MTECSHIKATIFFEKQLWVGTFERTDKTGFAIARHIFGAEPTDPEVHEFVLTNYHTLKFGTPKTFTIEIKRMNPKRGTSRNGENQRDSKALFFCSRLYA